MHHSWLSFLPKTRISKLGEFFKQKGILFFLFGFLGVLPFLDGGTNFLAEVLILILPFPLFLLSLGFGEIQFKNPPNWLILSWLLFLSFVGISVITSASQIFSIPAFFQLLAIFLFFNLFFLIATPKNIKYVLALVFIDSFFLCLLSFYYLLPTSTKPAPMNLVYATYGHNHLADYLLLAIPFAFAIFLNLKERREIFYFGGLLGFYLFSFVLTFSRGAFLSLPLALLVVMLLVRPKRIKQKIFAWFLILIPLGFLFLILIFSLFHLGLEDKLSFFPHWLEKQLIKPEIHGKRLDYWQQAVKGFFARPLVGFGWGTFEIIAVRFQKFPASWSRYAHNFYLQVLAEAGIFAFLTFFIFLFFSFLKIWRLIKKEKKNPFLIGGLGAILASSFHSFLDYDWHFPAVFLTFLFLLVGLFSLDKRKDRFSKMMRVYWGILITLSFLVFIFGLTQLIGEYYYHPGDYQKSLFLSFYSPTRARELGDLLFEKDFLQGERIGQIILSFSPEDPAMYYWLGDKYYNVAQFQRAVEYYQKAIIYNPLDYIHLYQRLGDLYNKMGEREKKEELYRFFARKLEETGAFRKENHQMAKVLYSIGEEYLKEGKGEEVIFWWEKATFAAPQWSFFYIDLASLYLSFNEPNKAKEVLTKCLGFYYPKAHCQEYLERLFRGENFESPGFWREKIMAIPDN